MGWWFAGIKQFIVVLLFHKVVVLTPLPIDVRGPVELHLTPSISAISPYARILLDVSADVGDGPLFTINGELGRGDLAQKKFPLGTVTVDLRTQNGKVTTLTWRGSAIIDARTTRLVLTAQSGDMPLDVPFTSAVIRSANPMRKALVTWENSPPITE